jgi:Ca-activated chloride channel family protein
MVMLLRVLTVLWLRGGERKNLADCTTRSGVLPGLVALFILAGAGAAGARQFVSGVRLVEVYATVSDPDGRPIAGLSAADFSVRDNGRPQSIAAFATGEAPLSLAVAIDRSFSMAGKPLAAEKNATRRLIERLQPGDRLMVVAVGSGNEVIAPLDSGRAAADRAVARLESWGTTPLYDAAAAAVAAIARASGRRALVLLSDGNDRYSSLSAADLVDAVRRTDVIVYPVAIGRSRPTVFAELASVTGGRSFLVRDLARLEDVLATIARDLRSQYLIGYPLPEADGRWHAIDVWVDRTRARVRARDGYLAPQR